ncbi:hydantoinase/oxoprolinase family protein [Roseomonas sp. CECT 9278]|uniref:hydantoinase/oxoprolinase family protein n=1 Tax=Roseomonas sp. CECT 9278 TaxID=2845823 RepID=UPI001E334D35|nr:hydantoinase/oxoprolinase family protein [Roseomonas sp. CECT 9278]CAH0233727.1 Acetophenone carboxylase gamma subunit [Roseomonas sp. CECT 9278]
MRGFRVGVDIGGTFTDIVLLDDSGQLSTRKVSTNDADHAGAIAEGLAAAFAQAGLSPAAVAEVLHATTIGSNAILERKGVRTGLITTRGFRDVLEIRTLRMPRLYDLRWEKPPPLVERDLRLEVTERLAADGAIRIPLDVAEAERAVVALVDAGVEAIAVCLIHAYANPAHERAIGDIARRIAPHISVSLSHEVLPERKEYERTSTTVINAYIRPILARYLDSLAARLGTDGIAAPLMIMQSSGGLMGAEEAASRPVHAVESGPAAGVVGARALALRCGLPQVVSFDMGGTTAKAGIVEDYEVGRAAEYAVGAGIMVGSRLLTGAGYVLKVPAIDLAEVGAGGGSLLRVDAGGGLVVGPESAGATPGPVCYGRGNQQPTVTDANLVLGYLNPGALVGGALALDAAAAHRAIAERLAAPLGVAPEQAAYGAHAVAASNMIRAIKAVSSERGRDVRGYALVAFGGNGPLFAAGMAQSLGMKRVLVPPSAGVFSALGLLCSDVEVHLSRTWRAMLRGVDAAAMQAAFDALAHEAGARLERDGYAAARREIRRAALMHYKGQSFDLAVPVEAGLPDAAALEEHFHAEHERTYGHRAGADEPIEVVGLQVVGRGLAEKPRMPERLSAVAEGPPLAPRRAYFGADAGWIETPVLRRSALATARHGPCIIEEYDATCLVPPNARASLDDFGNIVIDL